MITSLQKFVFSLARLFFFYEEINAPKFHEFSSFLISSFKNEKFFSLSFRSNRESFPLLLVVDFFSSRQKGPAPPS